MAENNVYEQLPEWFGGLPAWIQMAAKNLLSDKIVIDDKYISSLADICVKEARKEKIKIEKISLEDLFVRDDFKGFSITSIANIEGINAIKQSEPLLLPESGITAILGNNGSGKSGYSRILKKASGTTSVELLPNIYEEATSGPCCEITVCRDGEERVVHCDFRHETFDDDLQLIDVFDSAVAEQYIGGQSAPAYLPSIFSVLMELVNICDPLKRELNNRRRALDATLLAPIPDTALGSKAESMIQEISHDSDASAFSVEWTEVDNKELQDALAFVNEESPEAKLKLLEIKKKALTRLTTGIKNLEDSFSGSILAALTNRFAELDDLKKCQNEISSVLYENQTIDISNITWRKLWDSALAFSSELLALGPTLNESISDKTICPLCLRPLGVEGKETMTSLKEYVESKASQDYEEKRTAVNRMLREISDVNPEALVQHADIELAGFNADDASLLITLIDSAKALKSQITNSENISDLPPLDASKQSALIGEYQQETEKQVSELRQLEDKDEIARKRDTIRELTGKQYLASNQNEINNEIERLSQLRVIDQAIKTTASNRISKKANELSETLIAGEYITAFQDELSKVSGNTIEAELIKQRAEKGRIPYAIRLLGYGGKQIKPEGILSEGEKRVVALAAFLADARRTPEGCPLIFDDPICSLDESFEESVLERLVIESTNRQVIVFTHRISVVSELERIAGENEQAYSSRQILAFSDGIHKGNPLNEYSPKKKPKPMINAILNDLSKLKKAEEADDAVLSHQLSENACKRIRIALEACVEHVLLNGTVIRYRRDIQTKNKLKYLPKISKSDCGLIDEMMTKYSFSEHYAPYDEAPKLFEFKDLERDCKGLVSWIEEFESRTIATDS